MVARLPMTVSRRDSTNGRRSGATFAARKNENKTGGNPAVVYDACGVVGGDIRHNELVAAQNDFAELRPDEREDIVDEAGIGRRSLQRE